MSDWLLSLFPDAPLWVSWLAVISMSSLVLFILACLVASPLDAWRNRHSHEEGEVRHVGLTDTGSLTAVRSAALRASLGAATGFPPQAFGDTTSEIPRHRKE